MQCNFKVTYQELVNLTNCLSPTILLHQFYFPSGIKTNMQQQDNSIDFYNHYLQFCSLKQDYIIKYSSFHVISWKYHKEKKIYTSIKLTHFVHSIHKTLPDMIAFHCQKYGNIIFSLIVNYINMCFKSSHTCNIFVYISLLIIEPYN